MNFKLPQFQSFPEACLYVQNLPYKRNADKSDIFCIFKDEGGTCSTKHAFLKQYADDNGVEGVQLMLGIFRMNAQNTKKIASVLEAYGLEEMPEAHNYLRIHSEIADFTRKGSKASDFEADLIQEIEIQPNQITNFKVQYHKGFLENYIQTHLNGAYTLEEFWNIREKCISALQK